MLVIDHSIDSKLTSLVPPDQIKTLLGNEKQSSSRKLVRGEVK